jgi:ABC-type dipeptide/oligopeptide/nickel transport system permease subunit
MVLLIIGFVSGVLLGALGMIILICSGSAGERMDAILSRHLRSNKASVQIFKVPSEG